MNNNLAVIENDFKSKDISVRIKSIDTLIEMKHLPVSKILEILTNRLAIDNSIKVRTRISKVLFEFAANGVDISSSIPIIIGAMILCKKDSEEFDYLLRSLDEFHIKHPDKKAYLKVLLECSELDKSHTGINQLLNSLE
ncbi:MAG: hypothetical protein JXB88_15420 [Spirochaetales bacterium]|nr:hypothetical protein [Spirochaetales bacterium]